MNTPLHLALCGGVGGAKLAWGLAQLLPPESLLIAVNVGDDFEHLGLKICPDIDTVLYTLAGVVHPQQGWGRADESWGVLKTLRELGGESWFLLGDRDIALHLLRRQLLAQGETLSTVTTQLSTRLGVSARVVPVSDDPLRTMVDTDRSRLAFQDYFVRQHCEPVLQGLDYAGAATAQLAPAVLTALDSADLAGVILCPSNPYLSIAPMLAIPALRERLRALTVPIIAVSPIVAGAAIKGPTAKIMRELGVQPSALTVAELYADFVDAVVVDTTDAALAAGNGRFVVRPTLMTTAEHKVALARDCVELIQQLQ